MVPGGLRQQRHPRHEAERLGKVGESETPPKRAIGKLEVLTPAGIRGKLGGLPPGGDPSDMLFAVGKAGGDEFILLLKKSSQGWRVCGVDR